MKDDPRIVLLDQLNDRLEQLLNYLERPVQGARGEDLLMSAWADCSAAFEGVRSVLGNTDGEYPPEVRARVKTALRLHAVAASLTQRTREEVEGGLRTLSEIVKRIRNAATSTSTGSSCDISG